jgi:hypothetical protein
MFNRVKNVITGPNKPASADAEPKRSSMKKQENGPKKSSMFGSKKTKTSTANGEKKEGSRVSFEDDVADKPAAAVSLAPQKPSPVAVSPAPQTTPSASAAVTTPKTTASSPSTSSSSPTSSSSSHRSASNGGVFRRSDALKPVW